MSKSLTEVLQFLRQDIYYAEPRFHTSFAWALLDTGDDRSEELSNLYPTIPELPSTLVSELATKYGEMLAGKIGTFRVDSIHCKIGKDAHCFTLE